MKIDKELLKKRSEHNDGELSTLKEITLHQFDIEKIENLDIYCKNLEILFLQNNLISKIENLHKLKSLRYLNLALNNITRIENLNACESLEKLDLTVNFIDVVNLKSVESLKFNEFFRELYLVGNPCTQFEGFRDYVVSSIPQLKSLDGKEIEISERLLANQKRESILIRLNKESNEIVMKPLTPKEPESTNQSDIEPINIQEKREAFPNQITSHDPETRVRLAKELEVLRKGEEPIAKAAEPPQTHTGPDGRILQQNKGGYEFKWEETEQMVCLIIEISKYMDTSFIDVDVQSTWIKVSIKGKLLQLLLPEEVDPFSVICERSDLTGKLMVSMLKSSCKSTHSIKDLVVGYKDHNSHSQRKKFVELLDDNQSITIKPVKRIDPQTIQKTKFVRSDFKSVEAFIDDEEVPPLI